MPRAEQFKCTDTLRYISTTQWKALLAGGDAKFVWQWSGEEPMIVHVEVSGNTVSLTNQAFRQAIHLDTTLCHYGGSRVWFLCPECNCRATKLYLCQLNLSCRCCSNLVYRSQRTTKADRLLLKATQISSILAHGKPKHMRSTTYEALKEQYSDYVTTSAWLHIATHKHLAAAMLRH